MYVLFELYAHRKSVGVTALCFLRRGDRIRPGQTPNMLKLDDQDEIDCVAEPPVPADVWEALKQSSLIINSLHVGDDQTRGDTNNASTTPAASSATNTTRSDPSGATVDTSHVNTRPPGQSCKGIREEVPPCNSPLKKSLCTESDWGRAPKPPASVDPDVDTVRVVDVVRHFRIPASQNGVSTKLSHIADVVPASSRGIPIPSVVWRDNLLQDAEDPKNVHTL
jgi:hypothetical protein